VAKTFSEAELESKSLDELRSMLADDELLPLNDNNNTDFILKITELILQKEEKSSEQREAEFKAFCSSLIESHGDEIPIRLDELVGVYKSDSLSAATRQTWPRAAARKKWKGGLVAAAVIVLLLVGNQIAAYAFNRDILQVIISFSKDLFNKTLVMPDTVIPSDLPKVSSTETLNTFGSMQEALDSYGIKSIQAPAYLPEGFIFMRTEAAKMPDRIRVTAIYGDGAKEITVSIISFMETPSYYSPNLEKSEAPPVVYTYNGIEHYLFTNIDIMVATWIDGLCDCYIQGEISETEMKLIINSMYKEGEPK
jgi:hypothetical protein